MKKIELKLTNVARASLEELRLDYKDFLRQRGLRLWEREDPRRAEDEVARWVREVYGRDGHDGRNGQSIGSMSSIKSIPPDYPDLSANAALGLIGVASALLDRQIAAQANTFENEGGFRERVYRTRKSRRREE